MLIRSTLRARWLIGLAALTVLVTLVAAGFASAGATDWRQKVDATVLSRAAAGNTQFIVYLSDRADLNGASARKTKRARGSFVRSRLTSMARQTQAPLLAKLRALGVRHESFWITNAIWVVGGASVVQAMAERPEVEHVYAVRTGGLDPPVDTPRGASATRGANLALAAGNNISHVNADDVWALGYTGQGVVVASADTGVAWTHPALKAKYRGWNGSSANHDYNWHDGNPIPNVQCPSPSPEPCDDDEFLGGGHGTHTTGTMVGDDGAGNQIGMAPGAKWIACRNMNNGVGVLATYLDCMEWFIAPTRIDGSAPDAARAPDVVNNSWGCVEVCPAPLLQDTLRASRAAGIFYAVSAGNDGLGVDPAPGCSTVEHPLARYPEAFTVGATYIGTDAIAEFSSRGPVLGDPTAPLGLMKPNISAPGVDVRSSLRNGSYGTLSGTSMAGPHVAGLVALIISANPKLRGKVDKIEDIIEQTAVHLTTKEQCGGDTNTQVPNNTFGWGRIDALAAVREATKTPPPPQPGDTGDKATGGGWLADSTGAKINFGFNAKQKGAGFEGNLQLNDKAANVKIHLTQVTALGAVEEPCGDLPEAASSLQFRGNGTLNGATASFRVCVQDNGEGSNAVGSDLLYLECTAPADCSYNTGSRTPNDALDGGNVQLRRTTPVSSGGSAPQPTGAPQAAVLVLDPLLMTGGVAGQAQLFKVTVYDQYQAPLSNASVTLTRTTPGGVVETLNGVTGLAGTVTFTALNLGQPTEYLARAGGATSNAIAVTPLGLP